MIEIDGSFGEGGGQILRTSLTLSAVTGESIHIVNIRARRAKPGLRAQHVTAVRAAAAVCGATVRGDEVGSRQLVFEPGELAAGEYRFDIGTAGSTALVLQTVFLPLALAGEPSRLTLIGGTHNPMAPCFEYLQRCWMPMLGPMGLGAELYLARPGFYPAGAGQMSALIEPAPPREQWQPVRRQQRGRLLSLSGFSAVANLPRPIAERQRRQALRRLEVLGLSPRIELRSWQAASPGTVLFLHVQFAGGAAAFFALGARGKRAERVADEAADALAAYWATEAAVDPHLADQILLPAALCPAESRFTVSAVAEHLRTNAHVIGRVLGRAIHIDGDPGEPGAVLVPAAGSR